MGARLRRFAAGLRCLRRQRFLAARRFAFVRFFFAAFRHRCFLVGFGLASDGRHGGAERQQRDQQDRPAPHRTSAGRANDDAPGMIPAASTSSHCSSSEQ